MTKKQLLELADFFSKITSVEDLKREFMSSHEIGFQHAEKNLETIKTLISHFSEQDLGPEAKVVWPEDLGHKYDNKTGTAFTWLTRLASSPSFLKIDNSIEGKRNKRLRTAHLTSLRHASTPKPDENPELAVHPNPEDNLAAVASWLVKMPHPCQALFIHHSLHRASRLVEVILRSGSSAEIYVSDPVSPWRTDANDDKATKIIHEWFPETVENIRSEVKRSSANPEDKKKFEESILRVHYYTAPASVRATLIQCNGAPNAGFANLGYYVIDGQTGRVELGHDNQDFLFDFNITKEHSNFDRVVAFIERTAAAISGKPSQPVLEVADGKLSINQPSSC